MNFSEAFALMKRGEKVKLPSWAGYWYWSKEKQTIIMHTKDGVDMDIRETQIPDYTFGNIASSINLILGAESITPWIGSRISRTAHFMRNSQIGSRIRTVKRFFRIFRKIAMRRR